MPYKLSSHLREDHNNITYVNIKCLYLTKKKFTSFCSWGSSGLHVPANNNWPLIYINIFICSCGQFPAWKCNNILLTLEMLLTYINLILNLNIYLNNVGFSKTFQKTIANTQEHTCKSRHFWFNWEHCMWFKLKSTHVHDSTDYPS